MHPEIGSRTAIHLVECFGSAERLFAATQQEIVLRSGLKPELARSISRREYHGAAERELAFVERHRIRAIDACSADYPRRLKECPDYPHVIYVSGGSDLNSPRWLSVVGTRRMTPYGAMLCERLIGELAALVPDAVIVSGLAYGVDIEAHRAAMNAGLRTVGVVAHPLTRIYPSRHTESARRMVQQLEGNEGQKHLEEYADSSCERGKCLLHAICEQFGFDSLSYQSLEGMLEAIGIDRDKVCTYCWTGKE